MYNFLIINGSLNTKEQKRTPYLMSGDMCSCKGHVMKINQLPLRHVNLICNRLWRLVSPQYYYCKIAV